MTYSAQDYWNDLAALRARYTEQLLKLEHDRDAALVAVPAARPIVDAFHVAAQAAQAARTSAFAEVDAARERAASAAGAKRPAALAKAERTLRDARDLADQKREDARRKAQAAYDDDVREIEAKNPLHAQTLLKEQAADEYERQVIAADDARNRAWDEAWDTYQNDTHDVLDDERIAIENAETDAQRSRAEAEEHYEDTLRNAEVIMRSRLAAVAGDVQARFDRQHEQIASQWEAEKDALGKRYREGMAR
jgi:hypothetical protein